MKKIMNFSAIVMVVTIIIASIGNDYSYADNRDTSYIFNLDPDNNGYTDPRTKFDATSCYMYCKKCNSSYVGSVYGGATFDSWGTDCSGGFRYYFEKGYKRFMYNYVNEYGLSVAFIQGHFTSNKGTASGLWSPDSVPQSGVKPASDYIH